MANQIKTISVNIQKHEALSEVAEHFSMMTGIKKPSLDDTIGVLISQYWTINKRTEKKPQVETRS